MRRATKGNRAPDVGHAVRSILGRGLAVTVLLMAAAPIEAQEADWPAPIHDDQLFWKVMFEELEIATSSDERPVAWDFQGWYGGDFNRFWLKSEGERPTRGSGGELEAQARYSRLIAPFWEAQVGIRVDHRPDATADRTRAHLVIGMQGLAPYWFELEPAVFLSEDGDVSARVTASYDVLLSQRLVLQPQLEINLAARAVPEWDTGAGLVDLAADLRLRYELRREIAPYVGIGWAQRYGETADIARAAGHGIAQVSLLVGVRAWL